MALDPLATIDDLQARISHVIVADTAEETRAEALLRDASAAVRRYTGQQFTAVTGDTIRIKVASGRVILPQRPVTDVTAVTDVNTNDVQYTWDAGDQVVVASNVPDTWAWEPWRNGITHVDVTYNHGYDEIPEDIIAVVCQMAGRAFAHPADETGLTSETVEGYSYSVGSAAAAGAVGMLPDEKRILDDYRRRGGMARLA